MTKTGPVDSPNNPFAPELAPKKTGQSSTAKFVLKLAEFTPLPKTLNPEPEREFDTVKMASESCKGMPNRRDNKAPSYDRNRPEELLRYIEDVEKELGHCSIVADHDNKDWLRHYTDQHSSDEWMVLETYPQNGGIFADFKEKLVSHYPEVTNSLEGSIACLDKLCMKSKPLTTENLLVMLEFFRGFKFEGQKLLAGGCISNQEIIAKFLSCLDPELKKTVVWQVSQLSMNKTVSSVQAGKELERKTCHYTDPIEFETLLKVSEGLVQLADSYNTIAGTSNFGMAAKPANRTQHTILQRPVEEPTTLSPTDRMVQLLEDMNVGLAVDTDVHVNMAKENGQRHGEATKSMETMHTLLNMWHMGDDRPDRPSNPSYPVASNRTFTCHDRCHYCWISGHFIANCESLVANVAAGKIEAQDNGMRVDLKRFPKEPPHLSLRDRVDLQWHN